MALNMYEIPRKHYDEIKFPMAPKMLRSLAHYDKTQAGVRKIGSAITFWYTYIKTTIH